MLYNTTLLSQLEDRQIESLHEKYCISSGSLSAPLCSWMMPNISSSNPNMEKLNTVRKLPHAVNRPTQLFTVCEE